MEKGFAREYVVVHTVVGRCVTRAGTWMDKALRFVR